MCDYLDILVIWYVHMLIFGSGIKLFHALLQIITSIYWHSQKFHSTLFFAKQDGVHFMVARVKVCMDMVLSYPPPSSPLRLPKHLQDSCGSKDMLPGQAAMRSENQTTTVAV